MNIVTGATTALITPFKNGQLDEATYAKLIERQIMNGIDAVVIASPIFVHHEQVMKAIEAGKHLQIQKTMTSTVAEADDVIQAMEAWTIG